MSKKNVVIAVLFLLLAISGYFLFQGNSEKNYAFENNLKCAQYIEQQNKKINEIANLPINAGSVVTGPKIFFSPKLNTCVSAYSIEHQGEESGNSGYYIYNLLNNGSILFEGGATQSRGTVDGAPLTSRSKVAEQKFLEKLKELGGE